ncbi:MAG: hypothetical protein H6647_07535 [Anaerolineales bacterium]|nr:hypothetical protein [Anaerolineales bacterium]
MGAPNSRRRCTPATCRPARIGDGRPPFLVVVDVGQSIALYAEFTRSGGNYLPFPDPQSYRIEAGRPDRRRSRELLRTVWLDPMSLDPPAAAHG